MTKKREHLAVLLNDLIETCKNAEKGFREASEDTSDARTSFYLKIYGNQRSRFATVLQGQVRALGFTPDRKGSVGGAMHRGWMNIRSAMKGNDEAILSECKRGDHQALKHYEHVLGFDLPSDIRPIIEFQYREIKEIHDKIEFLGYHPECACS